MPIEEIVKNFEAVTGIKERAFENIDETNREQLIALYGKKEAYSIRELSSVLMPVTVSWLGNSSVATLPALLDLMLNGKIHAHQLRLGDTVVFASLGAGMNINALVYRMSHGGR